MKEYATETQRREIIAILARAFDDGLISAEEADRILQLSPGRMVQRLLAEPQAASHLASPAVAAQNRDLMR